MLKENIKTIRKSKGLSQEELAVKLNVVRQTISKWEQGLSVPDAEMLVTLAEVLETSVSTLLGETVAQSQPDALKAISEKLEIINLQFARQKETQRKILHGSFISICALVAVTYLVLFIIGSPYLGWDYNDPEWAIVGVAFHAFEWIFVRIAPVTFIGSLAGVIFTRKNIK